MTEEKTTRELVYETNRDVKWICWALQQMEEWDATGRRAGAWEDRRSSSEDFEARLRVLEGWRAEKVGEERLAEGQEFEHRKVREKRVSTISAGAGGVVGGVVAVIVKVLGGGWGSSIADCPTNMVVLEDHEAARDIKQDEAFSFEILLWKTFNVDG
jgi:hypothetical protein